VVLPKRRPVVSGGVSSSLFIGTALDRRVVDPSNGHPRAISADTKTPPMDDLVRTPRLLSVIVCLRSIQKISAIVDVGNHVLAGQARDSGDSTPAILQTRPPAGAGQRGAGPARRWLPSASVGGRSCPVVISHFDTEAVHPALYRNLLPDIGSNLNYSAISIRGIEGGRDRPNWTVLNCEMLHIWPWWSVLSEPADA
jgi:hypothetical protein